MSSSQLHLRACQYDLFARFFLELPTREYLETMRGLAGEGGDLEGIADLRGYFRHADALTHEEALREVGVDRTFLLRGTTKQGPIPPYNSQFSGEGPQQSMAFLSGVYRQWGASLSKDAVEAPDYLGIELAFMALLLNRADQAPEEEEDENADARAAQEFLRDYLAPFAQGYVNQALPFAKTGFCVGILKLLREFVGEELRAATLDG